MSRKNLGSEGRSFAKLGGTEPAGAPRIDENENRRRIRQGVRLLAANFQKRLDPDVELFWTNRLEPRSGPLLWRTLGDLLEGDKFPTLRQIVDHMANLKARDGGPPSMPTQTPEERRRANHAAILSMLWLHYAKDWKLSDFTGTILEELFGRQVGAGKAYELLEKAKEIYPKEIVLKWMQDQERVGN